jgi:transmembrane sensor
MRIVFSGWRPEAIPIMLLNKSMSGSLLAGGKPISETVAAEAGQWLALLMEPDVSQEDLASWRRWRAAAADHERAWQHMEAVGLRLQRLDLAARNTLSDPALNSPGRRRTMHTLAWIAMIGSATLLGSRTRVWQETVADYRTGTGEQREIALEDGTRLLLNTGSAVNVNYHKERREIRLVAGEIMIATGHASAEGRPERRPFMLESAEGRVQALGTRFIVRQEDERTLVTVLESMVRITPGAGDASLLLEAGRQASFTRHGISAPVAADDQSAAWIEGQLIADDMRLDDFLAELSRYRPGFVRCAPEIAGLRFSAVLPLQNTDRILAMLPNSLPVSVQMRNKYWVSVEAAR